MFPSSFTGLLVFIFPVTCWEHRDRKAVKYVLILCEVYKTNENLIHSWWEMKREASLYSKSGYSWHFKVFVRIFAAYKETKWMPWSLWNIFHHNSLYTNSNTSFVNSWPAKFVSGLGVCKDGSTDSHVFIKTVKYAQKRWFTRSYYMTSERVDILWLLRYCACLALCRFWSYLKMWLFLSKNLEKLLLEVHLNYIVYRETAF